jgi:hypothetical protein
MAYTTTVAGLKSLASPNNNEVYQTTDFGGGNWYYDSADILTPEDIGLVLTSASGGKFKRIYSGSVNVLWFGAIAGNDSLTVAKSNTLAFRAACLSIKSVWETWKQGKSGRSILVPAGDYNLSNGFTVPKSCSIAGEGIGVSRLKILANTADTTNVISLVSLGAVINDSTHVVEPTTGAFVTNPSPEIDNLYLNPQNSNVAVYIGNIPGFVIGHLWIQANIGVLIQNSSDGVINQLVVEDSTGNGVQIDNSQNIIINAIYSFVANIPVILYNSTQNIEIGILQANYSKVAVLMTTDGSNIGRVRIESLICNQNEQYVTFTSVVRARSATCDISIGHLDARNYNGYAINSETGLGNVISVDYLKLRQIPNNPNYMLGTSAKGVLVNNCNVRIGYANVDGINDSPFTLTGNYPSYLLIDGGLIGIYTGSNTVLNISGTNGNVYLYNLINQSSLPLFNAQGYISPEWANITNPFPVILENGRYAIKIPFLGSANTWNATILARTNNTTTYYKRVLKVWLAQETGYRGQTAQIITNAYLGILGNSNLTPVYSPDVVAQVDINSVNNGAYIPEVGFGYVVLSVSSNYQDIQFKINMDA